MQGEERGGLHSRPTQPSWLEVSMLPDGTCYIKLRHNYLASVLYAVAQEAARKRDNNLAVAAMALWRKHAGTEQGT